LLFNYDRAIRNGTDAPSKEPLGNFRGVIDMHWRMHDSGYISHVRSGIAHPLIFTPAELAVFKRAEILEHLFFELHGFARRQLRRKTQLWRNRLGVWTRIRNVLR